MRTSAARSPHRPHPAAAARERVLPARVVGHVLARAHKDEDEQREQVRAHDQRGKERADADEDHLERVDVVGRKRRRLFDLVVQRVHVAPQPRHGVQRAVVPVEVQVVDDMHRRHAQHDGPDGRQRPARRQRQQREHDRARQRAQQQEQLRPEALAEDLAKGVARALARVDELVARVEPARREAIQRLARGRDEHVGRERRRVWQRYKEHRRACRLGPRRERLHTIERRKQSAHESSKPALAWIAYSSRSCRCRLDLYTGSLSRLKHVDADGSRSVSAPPLSARPTPRSAATDASTLGPSGFSGASLATERTVNGGLSALKPESGGLEHAVT
eukprot:Unigene7100_Nuclearia_a/m.21772 Unigene7100_Nuclearia_a/g.21772  ORF Unigene7100_Nuclearia_a/g.21772 Unigene7100_Nuclearia_a/m.21772 type:complete len:332 (+) Unigene7100_Nuclearia_a:205-1200(+)